MMIITYNTPAKVIAKVTTEVPDIKDYTYMLKMYIADMNNSTTYEDLQVSYNSANYHLELLRDAIYKQLEK